MSTEPVAPPAVRWIARTLEEAGHETWAVGGAVRDALLGRPSGDWDLATRARPKQVRKVFRRTVPIGVEHGTVGVLARDGTMYEVTTFRRDLETDGRRAVVDFADTIEEDLARRDFTINAIAWHPLREALLDPFDGTGDLERGILRTVGAPEERLREDYLRILRALRFAGQFALRIEPDTWAGICALVGHLPALSAERIREELLKVLEADRDPAATLDLYARSGALRVLYPELEALRTRPVQGAGPTETAWTLAVAACAHLPVGRPMLRLGALLRDVEPAGAAALLTRLRLSNVRVDAVARLAGAGPLPPPDADDAAVRRWLSAHGAGRLAALARLDLARARAEHDAGLGDRRAAVVRSWRRCRAMRAQCPPLAVGDLALDGRGLIALGLKPGPEFGRILDALLDWVLDDPSRNREDVLQRKALEIANGAGDG